MKVHSMGKDWNNALQIKGSMFQGGAALEDLEGMRVGHEKE